MIRDGLRLTNPARTAIDIARMSTIPEALICLDAVLRRTIEHTLYDATSLRLAVHDHSARQKAFAGVNSVITTQYRWTGVTSASSALRFADPAAESALESQSRGVLIAGGVPRPECGMPVTGASGRVYWVDMLWSQHGVIGECDGAVKYTAPDVLSIAKNYGRKTLSGLGGGLFAGRTPMSYATLADSSSGYSGNFLL